MKKANRKVNAVSNGIEVPQLILSDRKAKGLLTITFIYRKKKL